MSDLQKAIEDALGLTTKEQQLRSGLALTLKELNTFAYTTGLTTENTMLYVLPNNDFAVLEKQPEGYVASMIINPEMERYLLNVYVKQAMKKYKR